MKKRKSPTYKHPMHYIRAAARKARQDFGEVSVKAEGTEIPDDSATVSRYRHEVAEAARHLGCALVLLADRA